MSASAFFNILFGYAFRPFFLLVGGYAFLMVAGWGLHLSNLWTWSETPPARMLHGHEMLFGFAGGAIAGFLLTAVATWTSRPAVSGPPLVALCVAWVFARLGAFMPGHSGFLLWSLASVIFWAALLALMAREVITVRNTRNYKVLPLLLAFVLAEIVFFATIANDPGWAEASLRAGLFFVIGMISLVGGRIIPVFTQNWLRLNRPEVSTQLPGFDRFDLAAVLLAAAFALGFVFWPQARLTGWLGLMASVAHILRLLRWQGWLARREPLIWVLHVGYAWIPVGFGLLGLASLGAPSLYDGGMHALTYGAIGTMILGVAARVALGHTGRVLQTFPSMKIAFVLITVGAVVRLHAPVGSLLMAMSVLFWVGAYSIFLVRYAPILLSPRVSS